jgi:RNA polymerase sigma-70 factor, ECF subfamily
VHPGPRDDDLTRIAVAAAAGEPLAQATLVRRTQADVWRLAAALAGRDAADDLTQETYLRALQALPAFEGRAGVRTWLLSIARRTCADHLRSTVRRRRLDERLRAAPQATQPDHAGLVDVLDLLRRLDGPRRVAFVLTQVLGLSYLDAAVVEGVPVGTVRSRVARARTELVDAMSAGGQPRVEAERQLQPVPGQPVRVGEQVGRRTVGDHPALVEDHRPLAELQRVRQVVGDHEGGHR